MIFMMLQDADATWLCELCLERRIQAVPASSAPAQQGPTEQANDAPRTSTCQSPSAKQAVPGVLSSSAGECAKDGRRALPVRRLRILCLHGFRQSASSLRGRTEALARKLADLAELVYVDAPHPLPFMLKQPGSQEASTPRESSSAEQAQHNSETARSQQDLTESAQGHSEAAPQRGAASANCEEDLQSPDVTLGGGWQPGDDHKGGKANATGASGPHSRAEQRRFRRAWLLELEQHPISQVNCTSAQ